MDKLPHPLLLQILSQLDDSADVASCRVASKAFDTVFPDLRSINLRCSTKWLLNSNSSTSQHVKLFKEIFLHLISKQKLVESVCIGPKIPVCGVDRVIDDLNFYLTDGEFTKEWLPRVSESLKSLSISDLRFPSHRRSDILPLISAYCHNLVNLTVKYAWLFVDNLNPMPMLTSLTLSLTRLEDEHLNKLNKCFPNLQVLYLLAVEGLKDLKIHLLNLKTCHCSVYDDLSSLTLITPNLITLKIVCTPPTAIHVEAPMLSHFHLALYNLHASTFTAKMFENLETLCIKSYLIVSLLSQFSITKTVKNLTLDTVSNALRVSKLTLVKVFTVFPNVSSLRIHEYAWSELEACLNPEDWEILDGRKGLKTFCAYLKLVDPSLTFSYVACVLDQCVSLSEVSLLIYDGVRGTVSKSFISKCMARWPGLKWRWGIWGEDVKVSWITDHLSN